MSEKHGRSDTRIGTHGRKIPPPSAPHLASPGHIAQPRTTIYQIAIHPIVIVHLFDIVHLLLEIFLLEKVLDLLRVRNLAPDVVAHDLDSTKRRNK